MKKEGYYTSGEFAKKAHITKKTIRYYDEHNILKPSFVNDNGARFYSEEDFARLQQIMFLKYLGFSLEDIRQITIRNLDSHYLVESFNMQMSFIEEKIEQLTVMKNAISKAFDAIESGVKVDWSNMLSLANASELENKLKKQYLDSSNISARIKLHSNYSNNEEGWFLWLYRMCGMSDNMQILELGCGDGALWRENIHKLPLDCHILLTDISDGMIRDIRKNMPADDERFSYRVMDAHYINAKDNSFDMVIANHLLFYCQDIDRVCKEIYRVLKPGGKLICSTYGKLHMKEISDLVKEFDDRIVLAANNLYERFGKENGKAILDRCFGRTAWLQYEDFLKVTDADALIAYVLSCHGNQNRYIVDRYKEFFNYVARKTKGGYRITKDAGVFVCEKIL